MDSAFLDVQSGCVEEPNAVQARPEPLDVEAAQDHGAARGVDDDAIRARHEHAGFEAFTRDRDRLGNRDSAEAAGIEDVDLAASGGFRDGAGERLAGRRAAARVDVVAHAGDPGPGSLRMSQ